MWLSTAFDSNTSAAGSYLFHLTRTGSPRQTVRPKVIHMKQPIEKFKAGSIECSLWENQIDTATGKVTVLKANIERRYKNAQGEWASTHSYGKTDLPQAIFCLQRAYAEIIDRDNDRSTRERGFTRTERGD